jgi:hypothetical protein
MPAALTYQTLHEYLGGVYSVATLRKFVQFQQIPHHKMPGEPTKAGRKPPTRVHFLAVEIDEWLQANYVPARAAS